MCGARKRHVSFTTIFPEFFPEKSPRKAAAAWRVESDETEFHGREWLGAADKSFTSKLPLVSLPSQSVVGAFGRRGVVQTQWSV